MTVPHRRRDLARALVALMVPVVLATAVGGPAGAGAVPAPPTVLDPRPSPGTVHPAGAVTVAALLGSATGVAGAEVRVGGRLVEERLEAPSPAGTAPMSVTVAADVRLDAGIHVVEVTATGVDGTAAVRRFTVDVGGPDVTRLAGDDRAATAAAVSRAGHPREGDAGAAVLARGDDAADALAGVPLAAALGGPLLLAGGGPDGVLPDVTATELARAVAPGGTVHLLGGPAALPPAVATAVTGLGLDIVRHAGEDRAGTAAAVAAVLPPATTAVLASGGDFPDALAGSVPAAARGWPVLLGGVEGLPAATRAALADVDDVVVVGGAAVLPDAVLAEVRALVPGNVERVAGTTRAGTAAAVAERLGPDGAGGVVALASGTDFPDALAGAADAAARGAPLLLTDEGLPTASAAALGAAGPTRLVVYGGETAVGSGVVDAARAAAADGPDAPALTAVDPPAGAELGEVGPVTLQLDAPVAMAEAVLRVGAVEVPTTVVDDGAAVVVTPAAPLPPVAPGTTASVSLGARVTAGGAARHVVTRWTYRAPDAPVPSAEGFLVATGGSGVVGGGPLRTFTVEVEPGAGHQPADVVAVVEAALFDPRSWTARGERSLQRIADPDAADVRVVLASPATVDRFCGRVGLGTGGIYSCWDGRRAMLNLDRYDTGAAPFDADLAAYRGYLVNHEVGHGFGFGHVGCPAAGALAPVMMQQTKGTGACLPNPWPYP